jgi:hypothetical protein
VAGNSRAGVPAADGDDVLNMHAGTGVPTCPARPPYRGTAGAEASGKDLTLPDLPAVAQTTTPYASVKAFLAYALLA